MSSTTRGAVRAPLDYYITRPTVVEHFLKAWTTADPMALELLAHGLVLDPCAGGNLEPVPWTDSKGRVWIIPPTGMTYPEAVRRLAPGATVITNDLREDSPADVHVDFTAHATRFPASDVIITNPPFSCAMEIIQAALRVVRPTGRVVMFLRLNYLGSELRREFFQRCAPEWIFVHSQRPSFTPDNKQDSIEYAHMVWRGGEQRAPTATSGVSHLKVI